MNGRQHGQAHHGAQATTGQSAIDPVCGMDVNSATTEYRTEHAGRTYYFCSNGCRSKFLADPGRYVGGKAAGEEAQP